jgi:hypothetical protein
MIKTRQAGSVGELYRLLQQRHVELIHAAKSFDIIGPRQELEQIEEGFEMAVFFVRDYIKHKHGGSYGSH